MARFSKWPDDLTETQIKSVLDAAGITEGVMYMEVPRCDECRHWQPEREVAVQPPAQGICDFAEYSRIDDVSSEEAGYIFTPRAFGCVHFPPRLAASTEIEGAQ